MNRGDSVTVTDKVRVSQMHPWLKPGVIGTVEYIFTSADSEYPYRVKFEGDFVVDPYGCPTIARNPSMLFFREELEYVKKGV